MYTVNCSACNHPEKTLFARVGAVMVCPACKAKVQLRVEDVKRQFKLRIDAEDELFRVPQVQHAPEDAAVGAAAALAVALQTEEIPQPLPEPEVQEDHSELAAEAERRADAARRRKTKTQGIASSGPGGAISAQQQAHNRKLKSMAIASSVVLAAVIGIVIVLSSGSGSNKVVDPNKDGVAVVDPAKDGSTPPPTTDGEKDKAGGSKDGGKVAPPVPNKDKAVVIPPKVTVIRVPALPLGIDAWQNVNETYRANNGGDRVLLINETNEKLDNGGQVFKAEIVSRGISSALVTVARVNDEDRVYARFERPFFLLDGKNSRPLNLSIPSELVGAATSVCWSVQPIDTHVANLTLLEDTLAEVIKPEGSPVMKVSAYNSSSFVLKDAAFVIQGVDAGGQVASQWRLKYPESVDARSWVKFEAELPPTDLKKFASWRVLGAGLPVGSAVEPPPVVTPDEREIKKDPFAPRSRGLFDF